MSDYSIQYYKSRQIQMANKIRNYRKNIRDLQKAYNLECRRAETWEQRWRADRERLQAYADKCTLELRELRANPISHIKTGVEDGVRVIALLCTAFLIPYLIVVAAILLWRLVF